jgi:hypothetical protein
MLSPRSGVSMCLQENALHVYDDKHDQIGVRVQDKYQAARPKSFRGRRSIFRRCRIVAPRNYCDG